MIHSRIDGRVISQATASPPAGQTSAIGSPSTTLERPIAAAIRYSTTRPARWPTASVNPLRIVAPPYPRNIGRLCTERQPIGEF